ncbi:MAG: tRNA lysidine(34) synthetase TilS [Bacteroidales bacterium]|nr:tRNA lysidine(34) synthetase TilS [Bacteroidales bacterium]
MAVSGGVDSMVMADLLIRSGYNCGIAHCNFSLRGRESDEDEILVKKFAADNNIPFFSIRFQTTDYADKRGISIQMAARKLRYDWFEDIRQNENFDLIALAHQADDIVETFHLNLSRGTGIRGLTGIPVKNGFIIRPLLWIHREELAVYAQENSIGFREDSSNKKTNYYRNRIRHKIIPEFIKINPAYIDTILSNIEHIKQAEHILEDQYSKWYNDVVEKRDKVIILSIPSILGFLEPGWYLFSFLQKFGFNSKQLKSIINSLQAPSGRRFYSSSHSLFKDRDSLFLIEKVSSDASENETEEYYLDLSQEHISEPISITITKVSYQHYLLPATENIASIDFDKLHFPLTLRRWHKGDHFFPLGMNKMKKLSDFFIDEKIPVHEKNQQWLLCSGQDIVWLVGHRLDNRYGLNSKTKTVLRLEIHS